MIERDSFTVGDAPVMDHPSASDCVVPDGTQFPVRAFPVASATGYQSVSPCGAEKTTVVRNPDVVGVCAGGRDASARHPYLGAPQS